MSPEEILWRLELYLAQEYKRILSMDSILLSSHQRLQRTVEIGTIENVQLELARLKGVKV